LDIHIRFNSSNTLNCLSVSRELRKLKPDLVVVRYWLPFMGPSLGTILRQVKKNKHTRVICIADNIIPHEKRIGDKPFTRYFIKPVDGFIVMSEQVLNDLSSFNTMKPVALVPHPLYDNFGEPVPKADARTKLCIDPNKQIVLFFGFIRKYKGLDLLLEAIRIHKLKNPGSNIHFLIAGEFYEDPKPYEALIDEYGIRDQLIMHTHFISDSEVKFYFSAADAVIQPYRNATQSGVTPLAYHFEVPMIVTNVGGLPKLVPDEKAGLVAEPTAGSLAQKIEEYFAKGSAYFMPQLMEEKKKLSWVKMTESIMELARSI